MLNESLISLSIGSLKNIVVNDLTILHISITYILMYVIYKSIGRYVYFKTQEHSSKINRTFLTISLMVVALDTLNHINAYLPFTPNSRWFYLLCGLVVLIALTNILVYKLIWYLNDNKRRYGLWINIHYLRLKPDVVENGDGRHSITQKNIHSDTLINFLALIVFIWFAVKLTLQSIPTYGVSPLVFSTAACLFTAAAFVDQGLFSWTELCENKFKAYRNQNK